MILKIAQIILFASIFALTFCSKGKDDSHQHSGDSHHEYQSATTKTAKSGDVKIVFDLTKKAQHEKMMKMMMNKSPMKHNPNANRFITLTLLKGDKLIKDAKVKLSMTGPTGKVVTKSASLMSSEKMAHYVAGFKMKKGKYKVKATIRIGDKVHTPQVEFDL